MSNESGIIFKLDASQIETEAANTERTLQSLDRAGVKTGRTVDKLGTQTKKTSKDFKDYRKEAGSTKKAMASMTSTVGKLSGAFAALGLGAAIKSTVSYASQVDKLSERLQISTEQLSRNAYATSRYGVDLKGLSDIYKDMSDRVGDFLQSGGGPMVDFFENIAPAVGVTAEQFRNLNGADALQLYVDSLEKANLSQNEMTFYMEAIASESSALLPLLRNNGDAMKQLGDQAARTGNVVDKQFSANARAATEATKNFADQSQGLVNRITAGLLPALTSSVQLLNENMDYIVNIGITLGATALALKAVTSAQLALNAATAAFNVLMRANPYVALATIIGTAGAALYTYTQRQDEATESLKEYNKALAENQSLVDRRLNQLSDRQELELKLIKLDNQNIVLTRKKAALEADIAKYSDANAGGRLPVNLEEQRRKLAEVNEQLKSNSESVKKYNEQLDNLGQSSGSGESKGSKTLTDELADAKATFAALRQEYEPLAVAAEEYKEQQQQINQLFADGAISEPDKQSALDQLAENYRKLKLELKDVVTETDKLAKLESQLSATRFNILDTSPKTPQAAKIDSPSRRDYLGNTGRLQYGRDSAEVDAANQLNQLSAERDSALGAVRSSDLDLKQRLAYENEIRQQYATEAAEIEAEKNKNIAKLDEDAAKARLQDGAKLFGSLAQLSATFAGDSSAITSAMIIAQKAASITQAAIAINTGIAQAAALPFPANLGAMATVAASTAGIVSTIQSFDTPETPTYTTSNYAGAFDKGGKIGTDQWAAASEISPEIVNGALVYGAAEVVSSKDTEELINGKNVTINYSPVFNVDGGNIDEQQLAQRNEAQFMQMLEREKRPGGALNS